jgi:hypothetical protein
MSDHLPKDPDESYRAGADILAAADKVWMTNGAAPDPFQPPERFRDKEHCRQWVVALSEAIDSKETALRGLKAWTDTADHRRKLGRIREDRQIFVNAFGRFLPVKSDGYSREDFVLYLPTRSYIFKPLREMWAAASINTVVPPVQDGVGKDGMPKFISASAWLDQDKDSQVAQMSWAPGEPEIICDKIINEGGWIPKEGARVFNLYRPPTIVPKAGPVDWWLAHLRAIYPEEAEHIIRWFAHRVQRPHEKINHALVLGGAQGIGKDTLLEPVKRAVGSWNVAGVSPQQVLGRFNGCFLKSTILVVNEARDLGEFDQFKFYEHLKSYTAAPPDTLLVDEKNLREYRLPNLVGVVITTNHKTNGIYLPADDRRHFVAWSEKTKDDFTDEYWKELWGWYENGGYEAVAAFLREFSLSDFNPKAPPPKTAAFWQIVDASRAPEDAEMADALEGLGWPDATTIQRIADKAAADHSLWLRDRKNARQVPHRLEECGYVRVRNKGAKDGLFKLEGKRQAIYAKKDLCLRAQEEAANTLAARYGQCDQ